MQQKGARATVSVNAELRERAAVLVEALPYIRQFYGKTFVVKYGGKAMVDDELKRSVVQDIVLLRYVGIVPIVVHGGGPEITELMQRLGKEPQFVRGLRVTDAETAEIAEMVLAGKVNKELVDLINRAGGLAVGLGGKDANLLKARKLAPERTGGVDLGFVGEVEAVNPSILHLLANEGYIPVVSSTSADDDGNTLNLNADHVAGKIAAALRCIKLIFLTDVDGIYRDPGDPTTLISTLTASEARELLRAGIIERGMVPKVEACLEALAGGVPHTHIINGAVPHALLMEIFTDKGIGTMIVAD
ncbi:Acetylglutamate kinase [bacterium HR17]|uniref:Acetylglutamate kinase n=1 Tax=Candidatus Fervidibacter japonicus TaxID=2035412 RepID=A0A2H5X9E3_9BACT|nr:Acetylglutamate kinase [bacterium HR17]